MFVLGHPCLEVVQEIITRCGGVLVVRGTQLLSGSTRDFRPRHQGRGTQEDRRNEEKENEIDGEVGERERESLNVCMRHGDDDETNKAQT